MEATPPVILCFAPLDPAGRAGIQAIAEVVASLGGHCASIATALCADSSTQPTIIAVESNLLIQQARSVLEDMPIAAIYVGYAGSVTNLEAIHSILQDYPDIPVVLNTLLHLWSNDSQVQSNYPNACAELLIPQCKLLICNDADTAPLTSNAPVSEEYIHRLFANNCENLLTYQCTPSVRRFDYTLYNEDTILMTYPWQADGCQPQSSAIEDILGAAITTYVAHDSSIATATQEGLKFTSQAATNARRIGFDSPIPNRLFWAKNNA
ncbi:bifunctional hydroxymethylpyrimidine kinase/phosphomethylpyrimidine kinase [Marinagarivorans algicola]|uniref:bifunctional hydroxymethylpyrimidine kinase/phosphomethylpyrimidine kinase n=1 Tax=Marinagarivorans algicola TaxID=1513270 RepID=UPI0006B4945F|nr:bifunctional hydroxymethylpyrimidine kinase/phosphomethylpyrimidine kinase [Marinagarivorans algicola]